MIIWKKMGTILLAASLLSASLAPAAMAKERHKVGKINLTIDSDIRSGREGGDVTAAPTGSNSGLYYVDSCEVTNDSGDAWTRSNPPQVDITLGVEDEDASYFASSASNGFKLTFGPSTKNRFYKVKFVDAKRKDSSATLILTVQLLFVKDADTSTAIPPSNLRWDQSHNGAGLWEQVSSSKYYQVQLIKDGSQTGPIKDIYSTNYNFADQITAPGTYKFQVRSIKSGNSAKSGWRTSDAWTVNSGDVTALGNTPAAPPAESSGLANSSGGQQGAGEGYGPAGISSQPTGNTGETNGPAAENGSWQQAADGVRWWWQNRDGSYPASEWKEINGQWYYFNADGYMAKGWVTVDQKSYCLDPSTGVMYANTRTPDNYWVDSSGAWVPGA